LACFEELIATHFASSTPLQSRASPAQKITRTQYDESAREQEEQQEHAHRPKDRREGVPKANLGNKNGQDDNYQNWHRLYPSQTTPRNNGR